MNAIPHCYATYPTPANQVSGLLPAFKSKPIRFEALSGWQREFLSTTRGAARFDSFNYGYRTMTVNFALLNASNVLYCRAEKELVILFQCPKNEEILGKSTQWHRIRNTLPLLVATESCAVNIKCTSFSWSSVTSTRLRPIYGHLIDKK